MAEDEFDPIPVLITKNPQGKKERMEKRALSALFKIVNVTNLKGEGRKHQHLRKEIWGNGIHCGLDQQR